MSSTTKRTSASKRKGRSQRTTSFEELAKLGVDFNNAEGAIKERIDQFRQGTASETTFVRVERVRKNGHRHKKTPGQQQPCGSRPLMVVADIAEVVAPSHPEPTPPSAAPEDSQVVANTDEVTPPSTPEPTPPCDAPEVAPAAPNPDSMGWIDEVVAAVETIFEVNMLLAVELGSWIASKF